MSNFIAVGNNEPTPDNLPDEIKKIINDGKREAGFNPDGTSMTNQASEIDSIIEVALSSIIVAFGVDDKSRIPIIKSEAKTAIQALIRTEKLKLLADVRERVVGENEPEFNTPKPEVGNMARNRLREAQTDLLTKMEAELSSSRESK